MSDPLRTDQISHTPGPWTVDVRTGLDVMGPDGKDVAVSLCREMDQLQFDMTTIGPERRQQAFDNALLIAAAPELLQSVREILGWYIEGGHAVPRIYIDRANAALAKAEGRSNG